MRHKFSTAQYSQGWIESQIEYMLSQLNEAENPYGYALAVKLQEQWGIFSESFDDLAKENAELKRKMAIVESALL